CDSDFDNSAIIWLNNGDVVLFFFQAEDGIRDRTVTGVQTCALPISTAAQQDWERVTKQYGMRLFSAKPAVDLRPGIGGLNLIVRSEERRVGKECRSRWGPSH